MAKNIDISKILDLAGKEEDEKVLSLLASKIVEAYPQKASSILKNLKNREIYSENQIEIISARELKASQKERIEKVLVNKSRNFKYTIDKNILGGIIIKQGELVFDNSLKTRVKKLSAYLG